MYPYPYMDVYTDIRIYACFVQKLRQIRRRSPQGCVVFSKLKPSPSSFPAGTFLFFSQNVCLLRRVSPQGRFCFSKLGASVQRRHFGPPE